VIGRTVLIVHVAAAKISRFSTAPAFDQTKVPRIFQVPSGAVHSQRKGSSSVGGLKFLGICSLPRCPPCRLCLTDGPWGIVATFEVLRYDSGFKAMSSGVRVPSEFAVQTETHLRMYGVNLNVLAERHAALHFEATRLQARAVDASTQLPQNKVLTKKHRNHEPSELALYFLKRRRSKKLRPKINISTSISLGCAMVVRTRTRTNTNPNDTEANAAGRSARACVARKSKS
jgi:hypothetical protein